MHEPRRECGRASQVAAERKEMKCITAMNAEWCEQQQKQECITGRNLGNAENA
jgi:hypothetical protein